ncbi:endonuclease [Ahniella affigens]|uniref:Endonuclease n=1 Tax=Ahniella affigens TaxID=2021234 RepID=A0A2P1PX64_9GAMM|nr:S1/P1 nuclease [Ahniella affigens]AVP99433.1 endonuclease [Ahniella affigens]
MNRIQAGIVVAFLAWTGPALAWGELGHRLVGKLAEPQLSPDAAAAVGEILAGEAEPSLSGVAYWADALRNLDPPRFQINSRWHYVKTTEGTCVVAMAQDCPDDACVVGAIADQEAILANDKGDPLQRREALKFLVHFFGDIHQPLHTSDVADHGANDVKLTLRTEIAPEAYAKANYHDGIMDTNLHSIWDYYLIASGQHDLANYAKVLEAMGPVTLPTTSQKPADWATESCRLIDSEDLYPTGPELDPAYLDHFRPLAELRIRIAARRLADYLNRVFRPRIEAKEIGPTASD